MDFTAVQSVATEVAISPDSTVSKALYQDQHVKVVLFAFDTQQELSEHTASMPAMLYFVDGEANVTLGETPMTAAAGTFVHMEPHLPHSITALAPTRMLLVLLKSAKSE